MQLLLIILPFRLCVHTTLFLRRIVKLTSPNLNYIIMFGVTCMYLSVILYSIPGFTQDLVAPLCEVSFYDVQWNLSIVVT